MAISCRKNVVEMVEALVFAHNALQNKVATDGYHRDLTQVTSSPIFNQSGITVTNVTVSAAAATDLPTSITLTNQLLAVLDMHCMDDQVHLIRDTVNDPVIDGYAPAFDLPSVQVALNALKVLFVAHQTQSGVHANNDGTSYGLPANATSLGTAETLANALKAALNTHMANVGTAGMRISIIGD